MNNHLVTFYRWEVGNDELLLQNPPLLKFGHTWLGQGLRGWRFRGWAWTGKEWGGENSKWASVQGSQQIHLQRANWSPHCHERKQCCQTQVWSLADEFLPAAKRQVKWKCRSKEKKRDLLVLSHCYLVFLVFLWILLHIFNFLYLLLENSRFF